MDQEKYQTVRQAQQISQGDGGSKQFRHSQLTDDRGGVRCHRGEGSPWCDHLQRNKPCIDLRHHPDAGTQLKL